MYFPSIQNQLPHRNKVSFPFSFVAPGYRHKVTTRAAVKNMFNWFTTSMQQHPGDALGTTGVGIGFGYAVVYDQQRFAFEKQKHADDMEMRKQIHVEEMEMRTKKLYEETKVALAQEETKIRLAEERTKERFFELQRSKQKVPLGEAKIEQGMIDRQEKMQGNSTTFFPSETIPETSSTGNSSFTISSSESNPPMIPAALEENSSIFLNFLRLLKFF